MTPEQLQRRIASQPAIGNMPERMQLIRTWALEMGAFILQATGESREQSLALTHLEEVVMWANKAVVLGDAVIEGN